MSQFLNTLTVLLVLISGQLFGTTLYATALMNSPLPLPCDTSPVIIYTLDSALCIGEATTLFAPSGNQSYLWNNGSTTSSIQVTIPGLYSVIVYDAGGCQHSSNEINVQVFLLPPKPQIGFEGPQGICGGTSPARLVTGAQGQLLWMNNAITSFTDVNYPTTAWVEVTDGNGCIRRSDSIQVDTLRRVTANLSYWYPGIYVCETDSIQVEVQTDNFPYTFQWENGCIERKSWIVPETYLKNVIVIGENGCRKTLTPNIQNIGINYELQNGYFSPPNVYYTCPNVPYLITITPDPGHTYMWSDGDVTTVNKPLIGSPNGTHYSLKVTWNNFCSRWEDIIVKTRQGENAKITLYADSICAGQYYAQFYTNLNNPVWNTGATTNTIQVLPLVTTTYTVSGTDDEGCARSLSKSVYVRPLPTFTVTGLNTPVCDGDSLLLTASGAASFIWGHGSQAVQGPVFHKPSNQLYPKLYATGANGCTKDSNLVANIDLSARFYFYPKNYFVCTEDSVLLDPTTGAGVYNWSNGSTDTAITILPNPSSPFSCTYTSPSGCSFTRSTSFYTYSDSIPFDTINIDYMPGDSVYLGGSSNLFNQFMWSTGDTVPLLIVHPVNPIESYTFYSRKDSGCTYVLVYILHKDTLPIPYIIRPDTICLHDSVQLTLSEPGTYLWQIGGDTTQSTTIHLNYSYKIASVYYRRFNGFTNYLIRDTIKATSFYPYGSIVGSDTICEGKVAELLFNQGYKYLWNTGDTTRKVSVSPSTSTLYTLSVDNKGCSKSLDYPLHVNQRPPAPIITGDSILCAGNSTTLSASSSFPILWNNNSMLPDIHVSPDVDKSYTVYCTDQNQCHSDTSSITVYVGSSSISYIDGASEICRGQSTDLIAIGFESCVWNTGDSIDMITVSPQVSTVYSVSGIDASGCSETRHFNLNVKDPPQSGQCLICQTGVYCDSGRVIISFNYVGFDSLVWSTGSTALGIYVNPVVPEWFYLDSYSSCYSVPIRDSVYVLPRGYFNARIEGDTLVCPGAVVGLNVQLWYPDCFYGVMGLLPNLPG